MIRKRIVFRAFLAVLLAFGFSGTSHAIDIEAALGVWGQSPSGDISYKSELASDRLDLENDLHFDTEYRIMGRIKLDMPMLIPNIYIMGTPMSFEGDGTKGANFTFGDVTFDVTAPFRTKIDMNQYDIALYYSIPLIETATLDKLSLELGLNAKILDLKAEITGKDSGTGLVVNDSESMIIPVPMIYAAIQMNPTQKFSIEGELRGIAYSSDHYYDLIARVKYKASGPLFVAAGYRHEIIKFDHDDIKVDLTFSGPFVEVGVLF